MEEFNIMKKLKIQSFVYFANIFEQHTFIRERKSTLHKWLEWRRNAVKRAVFIGPPLRGVASSKLYLSITREPL